MLKIKAQNPDLVIPANYYNEYVLLARTMLEQHVRPKGIYSVLGGAASSYKFVKEFPDAAKYIMDCNHWFDPHKRQGAGAEEEGRGKGPVLHLRGLHELQRGRCWSPTRSSMPRPPTAPRSSPRWKLDLRQPHMPYGPTKFVNGQNQGAAPVNTQVLDNDIKVIMPPEFANAKAVFPMPA